MSTVVRRAGHAIANNKMLVAGITLLLIVLLFGVVGSMFVTHEQADVGAGRPARPPNFEHLLGTDQQGRDVLANLIFGTPATLNTSAPCVERTLRSARIAGVTVTSSSSRSTCTFGAVTSG